MDNEKHGGILAILFFFFFFFRCTHFFAIDCIDTVLLYTTTSLPTPLLPIATDAFRAADQLFQSLGNDIRLAQSKSWTHSTFPTSFILLVMAHSASPF
jgi:hypothetical protein